MAAVASFEDFKPEIEGHLRYLQTAAKLDSKQTGEVLGRWKEVAAMYKKSSVSFGLDSRNLMATFLLREGFAATVVKMSGRRINLGR